MKSIIFLFFLTAIHFQIFACGTVESRTKFYFEAEDAQGKLNQLTFLNCEFVLESYDYSAHHDSLLVLVINDALKQSDDLLKSSPIISWKLRTNAISTFFRYEQLRAQENSQEYYKLLTSLSEKLKVSENLLDIKRLEKGIYANFNFPFKPDSFAQETYSVIKRYFPEYR